MSCRARSMPTVVSGLPITSSRILDALGPGSDRARTSLAPVLVSA
jgi:hypothetical protein